MVLELDLLQEVLVKFKDLLGLNVFVMIIHWHTILKHTCTVLLLFCTVAVSDSATEELYFL